MDFSTELTRCSLCSTDPPKDVPLLFCENDHIFCDNCFKNLKQSPMKTTAELDESGNDSNNSSTGIFGTRELAQELQLFKESEQNGGGDESCNTTDLNFTGNTTGDQDSSLGILNGGILENSADNGGSTLNGSANTSPGSTPGSRLNGSVNTSPGSRILQSIQKIFSPSQRLPLEKMAPIVEESPEHIVEPEVEEDHVDVVDSVYESAVEPTCHICQGALSARSEVQCKIEGCSDMILEYEPLIRLHLSQCTFRSVQCFHLKCQAPQTGFFEFLNFFKNKEENNDNDKQVSLSDFEKHYAIHRPMLEKVVLDDYEIYQFSSLKESKCLYYKDRLLYIFEGMFAVKDDSGKIIWPQFSKACLISTAHPDIARKMKYSFDILNDNGEAIFSYNGRIFSIDDTKEIRLWNSSGGLIFPNYIFTGNDSYTCKITVSKND